MLSRKWLREELLAPVAWPVLVAATLGLMGLVIFGWRAITQKKQFVLCVALGLWMVLLNGIINHGHNRAARHIPVYQKDIASLFEATRGMNVYYLADAGNKFTQPDLGFYIHSRRIIRPLATEQIRQLTTEGKPFAVLVVSNSDGEKKLSESGLKSQLSIRDKNVSWTLYRFGSGSFLDLLEPAPSLVSRGYVEGS